MKRIIIGLLTVNLAYAQSLTTLYHQALQNDPHYQAAYYQYLTELKNPSIAKSARLPQITATTSVYKDRSKLSLDNLPDIIPGEPNHETNPGYAIQFDLKQILYDRQINQAIDQANWQAKYGESQWLIEQQSLMIKTASIYMNLLKMAEAETSAKAEKKAFQELLKSVHHHYQLKAATKDEYLMVKAQSQRANAQALDAHYQVILAKEEISELNGEVSLPIYGLSDQFNLSLPEPNDLREWEALAWEFNLNLTSVRFQEKMAKANIKRIKGGHFPTFYLGGEYAFQHLKNYAYDVSYSHGNQKNWRIGLGMKLPLYQGGQVKSKTDQAKSAYEMVKAQHKLVRRQVKKAVHQSFYGVVVGKSGVEALHTAYKANSQALKASKEAYHLGLKTLSEHLKQTHDFYASQNQYQQARYDYLLASLKLKQAVGRLHERDIDKVSQWLTKKLVVDLN